MAGVPSSGGRRRARNARLTSTGTAASHRSGILSTLSAVQRNWAGTEGRGLADEVIIRLLSGKSLHGLGLGQIDGRADLRGLPVPAPSILGSEGFHGLTIREMGGLLEFNGVRLEALDLSNSTLESLRFFECEIVNCKFTSATCPDWRMWGVNVTDTDFEGASLQDALLGGRHQGRGNIFRSTTFRKADLRRIACDSALFVDCDFSNAKISHVDFGSTGFVRCRFAGELRKVIFWDHGFETGKLEPNTMEDVDFSKARFREVEFRRLDLDRVLLPTSGDHVVIRSYRCVLEKALQVLAKDDHPSAPVLEAYLEVCARWVGPQQFVGVFARRDFHGLFDEEYAVALLRQCERQCLDGS